MNVLIIDDEPIKKEILAFNLKSIDPNTNIIGVNNYQEAIQFITEHKEYIDLIILDWCFPADSYSQRSRYGMGKHVLSNMKLQDININVIICAADPIMIDQEEYPFVVGTLTFNKNATFKKSLERIISTDQEVQDDVKVKTLKPNVNSGYKRKKSSTPWWMK